MSEKLSLTELQLIIRDSLYLALPDMYWVVAEISEIKENYAGHCYLELIEKQADEINVRARVKAIIWGKRYGFLKSFFENISGTTLSEGLKILVKIKVEYHELYGLSLIITDIDPAFTIGEMAMKRQLVIKRLEQDGVFSMNKELEFPKFPRRIAIISSKNAAGYSDFVRQLTENNFGYVFYTALIDTAMQGSDTEQGVINALDKIALNIHLFDLVVIIRGGGSQSDLSWFDNYNIAYHVTQFPIPVITGIGHEKDISVTDMIAYMSLKTPTAAAEYIISCVATSERHILEMTNQIKEIARIIIEKKLKIIEAFRIKLVPAARIAMADLKNILSGQIIEIINIGKGNVAKAGLVTANHESRLLSYIKAYISGRFAELERKKDELKVVTLNSLSRNSITLVTLHNNLNIMNPENVLKRGYTITSLKGRILKKMDLLRSDDLIETIFSDGIVSSKVIEKSNDKS